MQCLRALLRHFSSAAVKRDSRLLVLHPASQSLYSLQEALRLGESLTEGSTPDYLAVGSVARRRPSPATFFGKGQVELAAARVEALQPDRVFVNHILSGVQQRNLERAFGRPVLDRVALIIEIFSQRARTSEARLQVELAELEYRSSRLVRLLDAATGKRTAFGLEGDTEIVSARERGRSGSSAGGLGGAGGQGESELQLQRRRITERRKQLLRQLEAVRKTRAVQRAARRRSGKPQVAIVGYTNAGKSSLLGALSGAAGVGVEDRLFATLDPTLRRVMLPGGRDVILSDTVGFISDLPHQLVEAFQATLEEVTTADLLLHVLDASSPQVLEQRAAVLGVLRELGVSEQRLQEAVVEVWNKVDLLGSDSAGAAGRTALLSAGAGAEDGAEELWEATATAGAAAAGAAAADGAPEAAIAEGSTVAAAAGVSAEQPAAAGGGGSDGAGLRAAAAAGLLPPAVTALLQSDAEAAAYQPAAVATSVLNGQGLDAVLAAVEAKLEAVLSAQPQRSRRRAKTTAAEQQAEKQAAEDVTSLLGG